MAQASSSFALSLTLTNDDQVRSLLDARIARGLTPAFAGIDAAGEPLLIYATYALPGGFHLITADPTGGGLVRGGQPAYPLSVQVLARQHLPIPEVQH